jgi:hypothetical protein
VLRLVRVDFEPVLEASLYHAPPNFDDDELTPVEVPTRQDPKS